MCTHKGPQVGQEEQCVRRQTWVLVVEFKTQPVAKRGPSESQRAKGTAHGGRQRYEMSNPRQSGLPERLTTPVVLIST
ncbi:hypothetical protein V6N11_055385 [Hibiscus sabdariffa]|uniref:Uncharacterized protein n=1 Tax=Hibiscus sabdariffa TaxID=183260 RepID=A0ABR2PF69_9ROSI